MNHPIAALPGTSKPFSSRNPYRHESLASAPSSEPTYAHVLPTLQEQPTGVSCCTARTRTTVAPPHHSPDRDVEQPTRTAAEGWATCLKVMTDYDRSLIKTWNEKIDGILLLSGLLSGVVTTFVVQFYNLLQPDPSALSTALLAQVSIQLAALSPNATLPIPNLPELAANPPFAPTRSAVCINALWFLSLTLSLLTAVAGLLVRQWLTPGPRAAGTAVRPRVRARQRQHAAFAKWKVPAVVAALPALLQLSVALFLTGLVELLWTLHPVVAAVVSLPVLAAAVGLTLTVVLPGFSEDCPYHLPATEHISAWIKRVQSWARVRSKLGLPMASLYCQTVEEKADATEMLDKDALAWTQGAVSDPALVAALVPCLGDLDREGVFLWVAQERAVSIPRLLRRIREDTWQPGGAGVSEALLGAALDAVRDDTDDTTRFGASRMDVLGLLAHLAEEAGPLSLVLLRRVVDDLLPILDAAEARTHHASRLARLVYTAVTALAEEAHTFSALDERLLAQWALRLFRQLGPRAPWPEHAQRAFEGATAAALRLLASGPHQRRLLAAAAAFFTHTTLRAPGAPWFALLRDIPGADAAAARETLVALHRVRWAERWRGRAPWEGETQYEVLGMQGESVVEMADDATVWHPDDGFEVRSVRTTGRP